MFTLEAEMKAPVRRWLLEQGMHVAEEFPTGWGICDLVGCRFNEEKVAHRTRQRQRQPLGSAESVFIYNQLPDMETGRGITLEKLASRLGPYIGLDRIDQTLRRLQAKNHVRVTRVGSFQKVNGWAPMHERLVAVELKLNRLTDVLHQARANRTIAHESFVGLPVEIADRVMDSSYADTLTAEGLGLLSVSPSCCEVLVQARAERRWLDESLQLWAVDSFWRDYRGKHCNMNC